jgi:hypothetical protein
MKTLKSSVVILALMAGMGLSSVRADQPHMHAALDHLRAARAELNSAEQDKGGWRARAIENVNRAIAETERGIEFARHH